MRRLAIAAGLLLVFVAGLVVTFPTEPLVAAVLARLPPTAAAAVERVGSARLGPGRLTLHDVAVRPRPDGPLLELPEVRVRPSLLGLLAGREGRPWRIEAAACGGETLADGDRDDRGDVYRVRFAALDLATCLAAAATGRASGGADLTVAGGLADGHGTVELEDARWLPPGFPQHLAVSADRATLRWTLRGRTLHVDDFAMGNPAVAVTGAGTIRFPEPSGPDAPAAPELDLRVRVQPTAAMPQAHLDLLRKLPGGPPDPTGARTFRIGGSLDAPVLGRP